MTLPFTRRSLLFTASALALAGPLPAVAQGSTKHRIVARPLPLRSVRLKPSIWATAVETNRKYLLSLEPDRLLHNFRKGAGLEPRGAIYGGWEDMGIAGHSLGHYLSALALMHAQTGDTRMVERLRYIVAELAETQRAHGDGYVGGTTVLRDGKMVDGKIVFEEVRRGDIRTGAFDLNGGWVPLYTWHKVHAGLVDAFRLADVRSAMPVLVGMSDYLAGIMEGLSADQVQKLLVAEHGGLNESFADVSALTGNPRYLKVARLFRHRKILDPLAAGRDVLPDLHANTQIPKVIGLARLYELAGDPLDGKAARFFYDRIVQDHSYVIGGNSEREHLGPPRKLSTRLSDRTCEHCNTYNMLKLARHLYAWKPDAALFDFYERAHLNHVMAAQHPETGLFVYFMPLASGAKRTYSTATENFWCCVGSGMESHAKHGDSIYWEDGQTLFINLFIPSALDWAERSLKLDLDTDFPNDDTVTVTVAQASAKPLSIALRLPGWAVDPEVKLNGRTAVFERREGYAVLTRRWRPNDRIELVLPMQLRAEPMPDNPLITAFTHGPVVLAADLAGPTPVWDDPIPGTIGSDPLSAIRPIDAKTHQFAMPRAVPAGLTLKPFFSQYDRRTAVYFPLYTQAQWDVERQSHEARQAAKAELDKRTIDLLQPGEFADEQAHRLTTNHSEFWSYGGRGMRQAWWGGGNYVEASMAVASGGTALRVLYWGEDVNKDFTILIDGRRLVEGGPRHAPVQAFVPVEYSIPDELTRGKDHVRIRFETRVTDAPFYELRTVRPAVSA
jgi:hypothetical protein